MYFRDSPALPEVFEEVEMYELNEEEERLREDEEEKEREEEERQGVECASQ